MYSRLFFYSILFLPNCFLYGQGASPEAIAKAQQKLSEVQLLFSKEHIEYAKASIDLAILYYQDEDTSDEGDSLAYPALRIIRKEKGTQDTAYTNMLQVIPAPYAVFADANLDIEEAHAQAGKRSAIYVQKLFKLAAIYLSLNDFDGHLLSLDAYKLLEQLPSDQKQAAKDYAQQNIDPIILSLVKRQVKALQGLATAPKSVPTADVLVDFAAFALKQESYRTAYIDTDSCFFYLKTALHIYEKALGTQHPKYQKAWLSLTKKMQVFYPMEKNILDKINHHKTANDQFIIELRPFLKSVDTTLFIFYGIEEVFDWVKEDLKVHHGGTSGKYYTIIKAIEDSWDLTDEESEIIIQQSLCKQAAAEFGTVSEAYAQALINLAKAYHKDDNFYGAAKQYFKAFKVLNEVELALPFDANAEETLFQKYIRTIAPPWNQFITNEHNLQIQLDVHGPQSNAYLNTLFATAWGYLRKDDLRQKGVAYFQKGLQGLSENNFFIATQWLDSLLSQDPEYNLPIVAEILPKVYPLVQLKQVLQFSLDSLQKEYGAQSVEYGNGLEVIADGYFYAQNTPNSAQEALSLYQKILRIYKTREGIEYSYADLLEKIVQLVEQQTPWSVEDSNYFFEELLQVVKRKKSKSLDYVQYLNQYAQWHYKNERIIAAEPYYRQIIDLYQQQPESNQTAPIYVEAVYNLARIYRKTGRYTAAVDAYYKALATCKAANNWTLVIRCFDDLGLLAHKKNKPEFALKLFGNALQVLELIEQYIPSHSRYQDFQVALQYTKIMRHIGRVHLDNGALELAESYYDKVKDFERDPASPVSFDQDISLRSDLAYLAEQKGDTLKAILYYKAAIRKIKDQGELAETTLAFAKFYQKRGLDSMATIYFNNALKIDLEQVEKNYTSLSEKERLLFLDPIAKRINSFFHFALNASDSSLFLTTFNAHLTIKGLALETSTNLQSICMATQNLTLQQQCHQMQSLRKQLAKASNLPLDVQDQLNDQIIELEKEIGFSSKDLRSFIGQHNKKLDFQQLQQILLAMETPDSLAAAIDFLVIHGVDEWGDPQSTYYAAVVNSSSPFPTFIPLATEEDLEDVLGPDIAPNTINYITDELESRYLYELIWEPLLPYIQQTKRLHICPTGILSKVAFGTLRSSDYGSRRIMDDWSIHYYSSLRDLLNPQAKRDLTEAANIGLIGGVKFTFTAQETENLAQKVGIPSVEVTEVLEEDAQLMTSANSRGEDFNPLPGTLKEVMAISKLFPTEWVVQLLSDTLATEENLSQITDNSPTILHIATHGYFFPSPQEEADDDTWLSSNKKEQSVEDKIANLSNPLLRSGLALAGINRVWKGGDEIEGLEDGILTALEVANMDLFKTQLVVLSACETGRGDIDNNEGIMGLRRAFKTAGAKQLIISLWKVPDDQTSELMQLFYKDYLKGQTAHKAFENAQHIMRKRYRNPYYWAAFLLIE